MTSQQIREKTSARKVLAVLVGLLASLLALEGLATVRSGGSFEVFAQETTTGPVIKLMNPDSSTSTEISAKSDGEDTTYHLVAWITNAPANPSVQFKYDPAGDDTPEINIVCSDTGTSTARQATPDTYECDWSLAGVADGGGVVRAELYSAGAEVAEDEEAVTINSEAQTVEIVYPRQGEQVGFYTGPDGIASGMIDVTTSAPGTPEGDEGTQRVTVYYSTAPPGAEPDFQACGTEDVTGGAQESIRCDLAEDNPDTPERENDPSRITAIAAVAGDTTEGTSPVPCAPAPGPLCDVEDPDSADAHRATGYEQVPNAVNLDPQIQQVTVGQCSAPITATVTDQNGRIVVGVNVDVHASGPTDNLFFDDHDDADNSTSSSKAPEGHPHEAAVDCEDTEPPPDFSGTQGDHERATTVGPDIKHIESADETGTDDQGRFTFRLYSIDAGGTQITVWADTNGDDTHCSGEAAGIASIGWNQAAPSPTGTQEETQPCPTPTETATTSPTATPTGTETTTPPGNTECSDGQDNDGDGQTDMNDPDCQSPEDDSESPGGGDVVQSGPCEGYQKGSRNPQPNGGLVVVGTDGPDDLRGGDGDDIICGLKGKDSIRGRGGADRLYGGGGHDDIRGNKGGDRILGQDGLDVIRGGAGADTLRGGSHDDTIRGWTGRDLLVGGKSADVLRAGNGHDTLRGKRGHDLLDGAAGSDMCRGGPGNDEELRCER